MRGGQIGVGDHGGILFPVQHKTFGNLHYFWDAMLGKIKGLKRVSLGDAKDM